MWNLLPLLWKRLGLACLACVVLALFIGSLGGSDHAGAPREADLRRNEVQRGVEGVAFGAVALLQSAAAEDFPANLADGLAADYSVVRLAGPADDPPSDQEGRRTYGVWNSPSCAVISGRDDEAVFRLVLRSSGDEALRGWGLRISSENPCAG